MVFYQPSTTAQRPKKLQNHPLPRIRLSQGVHGTLGADLFGGEAGAFQRPIGIAAAARGGRHPFPLGSELGAARSPPHPIPTQGSPDGYPERFALHGRCALEFGRSAPTLPVAQPGLPGILPGLATHMPMLWQNHAEIYPKSVRLAPRHL
mgnify:CR=1 FL=1